MISTHKYKKYILGAGVNVILGVNMYILGANIICTFSVLICRPTF